MIKKFAAVCEAARLSTVASAEVESARFICGHNIFVGNLANQLGSREMFCFIARA